MSDLARHLESAVSRFAPTGCSEDRYLARRRSIHGTVHRIIKAAGLPVETTGSWLRGDFHLTTDGRTFSDIDLVWRGGHGSCEMARAAAELQISIEQLEVFQVPKVSIHPGDSFTDMPLSEQRFFNLAELVIGLRDYPSEARTYVTAKSLLLYRRQSAEERSWEVAARLELPGVLAAKLGLAGPQELGRPAVRLWCRDRAVQGLTFADLIEQPLDGAAALVTHFSNHPKSDTWIYRRVLTKLAGETMQT